MLIGLGTAGDHHKARSAVSPARPIHAGASRSRKCRHVLAGRAGDHRERVDDSLIEAVALPILRAERAFRAGLGADAPPRVMWTR